MVPVLEREAWRELEPQLAAEHPAEAREEVGAEEARGIARLHEALEAVVVPARHAPQRRVGAQQPCRLREEAHEVGREYHVVLEHDAVRVVLPEQHAVERPLVVLRQVGLPLLQRREQRHARPLPQRHVELPRHRRRRGVVSVLRDVDRQHRRALDAKERRERLLQVLGPVVAEEEHGGVLQRQEPLRVVSSAGGWHVRRGRRLPQPIGATV